MSTLCIAFNGTRENGQFLGDQLCSLKVAYLFAQNAPIGTDKIIFAASPANEMHFMWQKFIDDPAGNGSLPPCEVVYDPWNAGDMPTRFENWTKWRIERAIEGRPFDHYRELYRRIDGAARQQLLCGGENGLRRKNIFEYLYYGQENFPHGCADQPIINGNHFGEELMYHPTYQADSDVFLAPHAKCQANHVFTFEYWGRVVHRLIDAGLTVTVNYNGNFCEELNGHPLYRKIFPDFKNLVEEVCRHKIVTCGNTGIGWLAAACGIPLFSMEPPNSNMPDYRYGLCGLKSLIELMDTPDSDYCTKRLVEEVNRTVVMTTGCFDVIHSGHIRHLEESRSMGTRLVVALNSDSSVKRLKGEGRPINNQEQRAAVLSAIRYVDEVRVFDGDDALPLIQDIKPMVLTNGCDHKLEEIVGKDYVEKYGGRVIVTGGTREQSSTKIIRKIVRTADILKAVRDASEVSPNPAEKLKLLADEFMKVVNLPGDVADVGAYRGGCSLILRRLAPEKQLHVFDTWEGNPHADPLCHHGKGEWTASFEECKALVGENELTHYYRGIFPATANEADLGRFCLAVIDPDTYQTVRDAIEFFWPRMVVGGKLFFDDYDWHACAGVKKAVDEAFGEDQRMVWPKLHTCVVVQK